MKSALMIWGGWDGHEPKQCVEAVAPALEAEGFELEISNTLDALCDAEKLKSVHLIVPCWTMGEMTGEQSGGLFDAIRRGVGLGGWHGGAGDAFRSDCGYQFMVGGQFVDHPGGSIDYTVHITQPDHPIVAGIADFQVTSEQYYMHVDPSNDVLATTRVTGEHIPWVEPFDMPVLWTRRYGEGKVFYSSLGHCAQEFHDVPEILETIKRGLAWAGRD